MSPERLYEILNKYAESQGIQLNKDKKYVLAIMEGLLTNELRYGYRSCPCRLATGFQERDEDIICPCRYCDNDVREFGSCYCTLYVSSDWNESRIPHVVVPERRLQKRQ